MFTIRFLFRCNVVSMYFLYVDESMIFRIRILLGVDCHLSPMTLQGRLSDDLWFGRTSSTVVYRYRKFISIIKMYTVNSLASWIPKYRISDLNVPREIPQFLCFQLTLIPAWISNYTHYTVWDETIYSETWTERCVCLSLGMDMQCHPTHYCACDYPSMLRERLIRIGKLCFRKLCDA